MSENVISSVDADKSSRAQLRRVLDEYFNETELRNLCFDMGIDYEGLSSGGKADKARELIAHCERRGQVDELERRCRELRPNVNWLDVANAIECYKCDDRLPNQSYFFGRQEELARINDALHPDSVGWGVLIDGAGGIGKTALAIRAGRLASAKRFPLKLFLSAKMRVLGPGGEQKLEDFQLPNYMALLAELAGELGEKEIVECNPNERANLLRHALAGRQVLLIIDNLEVFEETQCERLFQFLRRLPHSCRAIVTSRRRTDVAAEIIRLDRLTPEAAHALIDKLASRNALLAKATQADRQQLYNTAGGNPLLIEWLAGQLGHEGSKCQTVAEACAFMQSAPSGNDPLEYIFGDLLNTFTEHETAVLAALSHFTLPARSKWVAEVADLPIHMVQFALETLTARALVMADIQERTFMLPTLAATFLRHKRPEATARASERLTDRVFVLVRENGYKHFERFSVLEAEWAEIDAALPLFLQGDNARLQTFCSALHEFLDFTGRWDLHLSISNQAEKRAEATNDFEHAGWAVYDVGSICYMRRQVKELWECARRAQVYWAGCDAQERAYGIRLRGWACRLERNYPEAITAFQEALRLWRTVDPDSQDVAMGLYNLATAERLSTNYTDAERDYREAMRIAQPVNDRKGLALITGGLARLALDRRDWPTAEKSAREALELSEAVGRQEFIARCCLVIATAIVQQGRQVEALDHAKRAVEIFAKLRSRHLEEAEEVLKACGGLATILPQDE
jgi:tetratricopeptide (TPR) repeat protein